MNSSLERSIVLNVPASNCSPVRAPLEPNSAEARTISAPRYWEKEVQTHHTRILGDPWYELLIQLQDGITRATVEFFGRRRLRWLHLPLTTGSVSSPMGLGSDSKPVRIELCGVPTFLSDSMQFFLEFGCRFSREGCYFLMPSFRGEEADARHLCQFYHSEAEIPGTLNDVMELVDSYLADMTTKLLDEFGKEIRSVAGSLAHAESFVNSNRGLIPRVRFDKVVKILRDRPGKLFRSETGFESLTPLGERELMRSIGPVVWVTHMPHLSGPFYQAFADERRQTALSADLLMGIGETVGAGQRHESRQDLDEALTLHGVSKEPYQWYIDLRGQRSMQTSGFGLGTERYLCWLLNHEDVRDLQLVPRFNGLKHLF